MNNTQNITIRCVQINLQKSRKATQSLCQFITEKSIHIAFVQEPYTQKNKVAGFPNTYKILQAGTDRKRASIIVTNSYITTLMNSEWSTEDMVWAEFKLSNFSFWAASIYLDKTRDIKNDIIILESINTKINSKLLLALDSNCRSTTWYDRITERRAEQLEEYLSSFSLHTLNIDQDKPTFETIRGYSNIDITISNNSMLKYINDWKIDDEVSASDHNYITFTIETNIKNLKSNKFMFNTRKACWEKFNKFILKKFSDCLNCEQDENSLIIGLKTSTNFENTVDNISKAMTSACMKSTPVIKPAFMNKRKTVPWWTKDLDKARKNARKARKQFQKIKKDPILRDLLKIQFSKQQKDYKILLDKAKFDSWQKYYTSNENNPWYTIYKKVTEKIKKPQQISTIQKTDGTFTTGISDTADELMKKFLPKDNPATDTDTHKKLRDEMILTPTTENDLEFTVYEIKAALSRAASNKAPGEDGITNEILSKAFTLIPNFFTCLFNECLKRSCFPRCWKISNIVVIEKPGRESVKTAGKYRPISLLSCLAKLLEKLLIDRILHFLYKNKLLSENQYGFRPQTSTTDAIMTVKRFVENHLQQKRHVALISLDVEGAFDAAWWPMIIYQLRIKNLPANLMKLVQSYFTDRSTKLNIESYTNQDSPTCGCPQGSTSSPGYWIIQYDSLLKLPYPTNCLSIAFADDYLLLAAAKSEEELEVLSNEAMRQVSSWATDNKLTFSKEKSQLLHITRKRHKKELSIILNGTKIKSIPHMKYLGVTLSENWSWNKHIDNITSKVLGFVNILSKSAKVTWGIGTKSLRFIYDGAFCPMLLYAAPVWIGGLNSKLNQKKLNSVQRLMAIRMIKGYRTISHQAACVIAGILPICEKLKQENEIYAALTNHIPTWINAEFIEKPIKYSMWPHPALFTPLSITDIQTDSNFEYAIYTDGSKNEQGVGCAFIVYKNNQLYHQQSFCLEDYCSNNQAEQLAILKALTWTISNPLNFNKIVVRTDSRITLDSLDNPQNQNPLIYQIREAIKDLSKKGQIYFFWIKAHSGNDGNEMADTLAKLASNASLEKIYSHLPKSTLHCLANKRSDANWEILWKNTQKGVITKIFFPTIQARRRYGKWEETYKMTMILTGHGKLRQYLHRFNLNPKKECPCNDVTPQSPQHLITECYLLDHIRTPLIRQYATTGKIWPPSDLSDLITTKDIKPLFIKFINAIDFEMLHELYKNQN